MRLFLALLLAFYVVAEAQGFPGQKAHKAFMEYLAAKKGTLYRVKHVPQAK